MKICMAGALGRMGRRIMELAAAAPDLEVGGAFDLPQHDGTEIQIGAETGKPRPLRLAKDAAAALSSADVLIVFTSPAATLDNVAAAVQAGKPAVVGTTGLNDRERAQLVEFAKTIPIVFAPNTSVGVNLLFKLTLQVAKTLGLDYNVEIVETHHNQKVDAPSGTALRLAERAAEGLGLDYPAETAFSREGMTGKRPQRQIGVHALRGGDVIGDHTVSFIGDGERIELTHKAHSRDMFARGALVAARFVAKAEPGLYDMQDVLGLK